MFKQTKQILKKLSKYPNIKDGESTREQTKGDRRKIITVKVEVSNIYNNNQKKK